MPMYDVEFSYNLPEWGSIQLYADSVEQAERIAMEELEATYTDISNLSIDGVKEIHGEDGSISTRQD